VGKRADPCLINLQRRWKVTRHLLFLRCRRKDNCVGERKGGTIFWMNRESSSSSVRGEGGERQYMGMRGGSKKTNTRNRQKRRISTPLALQVMGGKNAQGEK